MNTKEAYSKVVRRILDSIGGFSRVGISVNDMELNLSAAKHVRGHNLILYFHFYFKDDGSLSLEDDIEVYIKEENQPMVLDCVRTDGVNVEVEVLKMWNEYCDF